MKIHINLLHQPILINVYYYQVYLSINRLLRQLKLVFQILKNIGIDLVHKSVKNKINN